MDQQLKLDLGVPAARSARTYGLAGLATTAVIGLVVWDVIGIILGAGLIVLAAVRIATTWRSTAEHPTDRRALVVGLAAVLAWAPLTALLVISAMDVDDEHGVDGYCAASDRIEAALGSPLGTVTSTDAARTLLAELDPEVHADLQSLSDLAPDDVIAAVLVVELRATEADAIGSLEAVDAEAYRHAGEVLVAFNRRRCS